MGKEAAKAKEIVRSLTAQIIEEVDSLVDLDAQGDYNTAEVQNILGDRCRKAEARLAELEAERLRFYHSDGTFETLATPEEVIQRRIECAQRLGL